MLSTSTPSSRRGRETVARGDAVLRSRRAQAAWAATPLRERLRRLRRLRGMLARDAVALADAIGRPAPDGRATSLAAEVLPLADACRWLEREAAAVLAPRRLGRRGRPAWLSGVDSRVEREALGVVLILAPSNYPLFLSGVQALQALAAGNAVLVKPAPGCSAPMTHLADLLEAAGLDPALFVVLPEDVEALDGVLGSPVDKVFLTGAAATGRAVLARLAQTLTPAVMELSGSDAVFVLPGADLGRVAEALRFGLTFNESATCIAPRRVFVPRERVPALESALRAALGDVPAMAPSPRAGAAVRQALGEALLDGARLVVGSVEDGALRLPAVLSDVRPRMRVARTDLFAPVLSLLAVDDEEDALSQARQCPYALGASVFGPEGPAVRLAERVHAGLVTINDLIAPSADPRIPFGGRGESGFGTTRGREGLLEMTVPKAVVVRRGRSRPHFERFLGGEDVFFAAWVRMAHGASWRERRQGLKQLMAAGRALMRRRRVERGERGDRT